LLPSELDVSKNVLTDIPDTIKQCKQLAVLDASVNPLQKIPGAYYKGRTFQIILMMPLFQDELLRNPTLKY